MSKHHDFTSSSDYKRTLYDLRVQLVKLQNYVIREGLRILVVLEGRDGAGKDGTIKRIVKHLSPRETRVVALAKPSNREESSWYWPWRVTPPSLEEHSVYRSHLACRLANR